jgi:hypothetical protein
MHEDLAVAMIDKQKKRIRQRLDRKRYKRRPAQPIRDTLIGIAAACLLILLFGVAAHHHPTSAPNQMQHDPWLQQ